VFEVLATATSLASPVIVAFSFLILEPLPVVFAPGSIAAIRAGMGRDNISSSGSFGAGTSFGDVGTGVGDASGTGAAGVCDGTLPVKIAGGVGNNGGATGNGTGIGAGSLLAKVAAGGPTTTVAARVAFAILDSVPRRCDRNGLMHNTVTAAAAAAVAAYATTGLRRGIAVGVGNKPLIRSRGVCDNSASNSCVIQRAGRNKVCPDSAMRIRSSHASRRIFGGCRKSLSQAS
jgi:hypothetical protein